MAHKLDGGHRQQAGHARASGDAGNLRGSYRDGVACRCPAKEGRRGRLWIRPQRDSHPGRNRIALGWYLPQRRLRRRSQEVARARGRMRLWPGRHDAFVHWLRMKSFIPHRSRFIGVEGLLRCLPRLDRLARGARHGVHQAHCHEGSSASGPHSGGAPIGGFPWQVGGVWSTLERMVTLAEIESAAAGLSPAEKQERMLFLA